MCFLLCLFSSPKYVNTINPYYFKTDLGTFWVSFWSTETFIFGKGPSIKHVMLKLYQPPPPPHAGRFTVTLLRKILTPYHPYQLVCQMNKFSIFDKFLDEKISIPCKMELRNEEWRKGYVPGACLTLLAIVCSCLPLWALVFTPVGACLPLIIALV